VGKPRTFSPPVIAFVTKLSPTGTVVYSTFLGGTQDETASSIAIDTQGNA
jgi:hypothetical protein